jgi:hypothetical protein
VRIVRSEGVAHPAAQRAAHKALGVPRDGQRTSACPLLDSLRNGTISSASVIEWCSASERVPTGTSTPSPLGGNYRRLLPTPERHGSLKGSSSVRPYRRPRDRDR